VFFKKIFTLDRIHISKCNNPATADEWNVVDKLHTSFNWLSRICCCTIVHTAWKMFMSNHYLLPCE